MNTINSLVRTGMNKKKGFFLIHTSSYIFLRYYGAPHGVLCLVASFCFPRRPSGYTCMFYSSDVNFYGSYTIVLYCGLLSHISSPRVMGTMSDVLVGDTTAKRCKF